MSSKHLYALGRCWSGTAALDASTILRRALGYDDSPLGAEPQDREAPLVTCTIAWLCLALLTGCGGAAPAPSPPPRSVGPAAAPAGDPLALPWAGVYTDGRRTLTIEREGAELRGQLEDYTVPGWSRPMKVELRAGEGEGLAGECEDPRAVTRVRLALEGERLKLTTVREGLQGERFHTLLRRDPLVRIKAEAIYTLTFRGKVVDTPYRKAELLQERARGLMTAGKHGDAGPLLEAAAELFEPDPRGVAACLYMLGTCRLPGHDPREGSFALAARAFAASAGRSAGAGDNPNQALALFALGRVYDPASKNPGADYELARERYEQAIAVGEGTWESADSLRRFQRALGALLHSKAWDGQPDRGKQLSWPQAAALYQRAAKLRGQAGDKVGVARSRQNLAHATQPDKNKSGTTWELAAERHGHAARAWRSAGEKGKAQWQVRAQAVCLCRAAAEVPDSKAGPLLERARSLADGVGHTELVERIDAQLKQRDE